MTAIALPIVAHLLNRRARRRLVFPTIRLLQEASASQSTLFRLRRPLLLALRCAAIILIAWAFARPVWIDSPAAAASGRRAAVVIVLDVSASAAATAGDVTTLHSISAAAMRILDQLDSGLDTANLIFAGAQPRAAHPQLIANLNLLHAELRQLTATQERADLSAAVAAAVAMLAEHSGPRQLHILSDMQASNWEDVDLSPLRSPVASNVQLSILPIGGVESNLGLSRPRVQPASPPAAQPAQIGVTAANHSDLPRDTAITAIVNDVTIGTKRVQLAPRQRAEAVFDLTFDAPGEYRIQFSTPADELAADNDAYLIARSVARIPVLVIGDDDPQSPTGSSYFLLRALSPAADAGGGLDVQFAQGRALDAARLRGMQAVIIGDASALDASAISALTDYIDAGGGVLMFCGEGPVAENAAALAASISAGQPPILPWLPGARRSPSGDDGAFHIGDGLWSIPPLDIFDAAAQDALRRISFHRTFTTLNPDDAAVNLLTYSDGTPALGIQHRGRGKFMLANFSPSPDSSDLAKHPLFVALMHGLVSELRPQRDERGAVTVGQMAIHSINRATEDSPFSAAAQFTITAPNGVSTSAAATTDSDSLTIPLPRTTHSGFYSITSVQRQVGFVAANIDERESDLRRIDVEELKSREDFAAAGASVVSEGDDAGLLRPHGRDLWPMFVIAAMAVLGLEMLLLCVWKR